MQNFEIDQDTQMAHRQVAKKQRAMAKIQQQREDFEKISIFLLISYPTLSVYDSFDFFYSLYRTMERCQPLVIFYVINALSDVLVGVATLHLYVLGQSMIGLKRFMWDYLDELFFTRFLIPPNLNVDCVGWVNLEHFQSLQVASMMIFHQTLKMLMVFAVLALRLVYAGYLLALVEDDAKANCQMYNKVWLMLLYVIESFFYIFTIRCVNFMIQFYQLTLGTLYTHDRYLGKARSRNISSTVINVFITYQQFMNKIINTTKTLTVHLCPGQGLQKVGMIDKYLSSLTMQNTYLKLVQLVPNLKQIMELGPQSTLNETEYAQPAIFLHTYLAFLHRHVEKDEQSVCIGHSVGEYTALVLQNQVSPEVTIDLVWRRGLIMKALSQGRDLGMLAVRSSNVQWLQSMLTRNSSIALLNSPKQTVISGEKGPLSELQRAMKLQNVPSVFIPVSSAFHNALLRPGKQEFKQLLERNLPIHFKLPTNVISNFDGQMMEDREHVITNLVEQFDHPVQFQKCVESVLASHPGRIRFVEYGSSTLTQFVKDIVVAPLSEIEYEQI